MEPSGAPSSTASTASAVSATPTHLKVTFRAGQIAKDVSSANSSLSLLLVNKALDQYTQVLAAAPGHPAAFLNRSLCYLVLGFPHLAVTDAHRALLSARATLEHWVDELDCRAHLCNLHTYALRQGEQWTKPNWCFVAQGVLGVLDAGLASICVKPHTRGKLEPKWSSVRRTEELLLRDVMLKAYYRLAVALWKCGGGAWQSAMDQICLAESLPYCDDEDRKELQALHNLILWDIERGLADEKRFHDYCRVTLHYDAALVEQYRAAGISGLMQSRFTKVPREMFPWDTHSVASETSAQNLTASLNAQMAQLSTKCEYSMQSQTVAGGVPLLVLIAREAVKAHEAVFSERTLLQIAYLSPHTAICETCAAMLVVPDALKARAEDALKARTEEKSTGLSFRLSELQMESRAGSGQAIPKEGEVIPSEDVMMDSESEDEDAIIPDSPAEPAVSATPQGPKAREGYQICPECRAVAYCSLECKHKGSNLHAYICKTPVRRSDYKALSPNIWSTPSPVYTTLLDRIFQRTICMTLAEESPLSHEWVKALHGDMASPRRLPSDCDTSGEGHVCSWDESKSVSMAHLFPQWENLVELTAGHRKDSSHEAHAPESGDSAHKTSSDTIEGEVFDRSPTYIDRLTSGPVMDWSYDTNVRQPLQLLYSIGRRHCRQSGLLMMLDVTRWDGWVLETLRAKSQAGLGIQEYPKMRIHFNDKGEWKVVHNYEQRVEKDPYGPPLFGTDHHRWIASMHPLMTGLKEAEGDEKPNVRVLERNGRLFVVALRDIETGEQLLR